MRTRPTLSNIFVNMDLLPSKRLLVRLCMGTGTEGVKLSRVSAARFHLGLTAERVEVVVAQSLLDRRVS